MYAIVDIAGHQYKVEKNQEIFVNRLQEKEGSKLKFKNVLLIENKGKISVGTPNIPGASVSAKILTHLKGDKVIVFKKKKRKGFQTSNGHRDFLTKIQIDKITTKAIKTETKKEVKPKTKAETNPIKKDKPEIKVKEEKQIKTE